MRLRHKKGAEDLVLNNPYCIINITATEIKDYPVYFDINKPLELELGMGKGQFIINKSLAFPNINYIGIEKSATIVLKAIDNYKTITKSESVPQNLKFLCEDIERLENYFKPHSIDKIYLNFSDPWPKKRHKERRLTHNKFLKIYEKLLKKDGIIEFKTDNKDLFDFSLEEIKNSDFKLIEYTYDLHNDSKMNVGNIMTEYEEKFSKKGNNICKLIMKKNINITSSQ